MDRKKELLERAEAILLSDERPTALGIEHAKACTELARELRLQQGARMKRGYSEQVEEDDGEED